MKKKTINYKVVAQLSTDTGIRAVKMLTYRQNKNAYSIW